MLDTFCLCFPFEMVVPLARKVTCGYILAPSRNGFWIPHVI